MEENDITRKDITLEQLGELREKTEALSLFLQNLLKGYLRTLQPLLVPGRLLGRYAGAKEDVPGAEKILSQLQEKYKEVCVRPFSLPAELDKEPVTLMENSLELYPWEYAYEAKGPRETKIITMTSPLCWVLTYRSAYTFAQIQRAVTGIEERRQADLRQFIVNALVMEAVLGKFSGIQQILTDLRFRVQTEKAPDLGSLPLTVIHGCLSSFRPSDEIIVAATRFSGVPAFIELVDLGTIDTLQDPLKLKIEELIK